MQNVLRLIRRWLRWLGPVCGLDIVVGLGHSILVSRDVKSTPIYLGSHVPGNPARHMVRFNVEALTEAVGCSRVVQAQHDAEKKPKKRSGRK